MLKETFASSKPIIAMVHLPALPGPPGYDAKGGMARIIDAAAADIDKLQAGGVDALMFGNECDRPYILKASPESLAAMSAPAAPVALGVATGARFGREVMTGVYESDMGLWAPDCAGALRLRHNLGREDFKLMYNVSAEFASPVGSRNVAQRARSAVFSSLADVVLVSGVMTGEAVETS